MNPRLPKSVLLPLAAGLVQILSGCMSSTVNDPDKSAGGSDEIDTRIAVDREGRPVVAARIALVRGDDSTGKAVALSATGKDGSYPSFMVPDGLYSVVLRDAGDSLGKFLDSMPVRNQKLPSGRDTLLALGEVRGVVRVAASHSPATVSVGLLGTDILANVKADGTFRIELVPGGLYTLGAFPSLDGYGPLYKRFQLKDGQDLTLPDTLVLPFTGLPSPGALRVLQDTGTGNVRLSWNRVDHPDLLGYMVERMEGGVVTSSRYLTDTSWTDSLGASWEAMPLLGPWPAREVAYRVRSRSLSGSPDSKSAAQALTAKPPEWTKRVDSVKVVMTTDSVTGVTTLKWNAPKHPDLLGWSISRAIDGNQDCSEGGANGEWTDSKCPDVRFESLDSTQSSKNPIRLVREKTGVIRYSLQTQRRVGAPESIAEPSRKLESNYRITWRDSVLSESDNEARFEAFGGWILKRHVFNAKTIDAAISRDGVAWEAIPHALDVATGIDDSVWTGELNSDGLHLTLRCRQAFQDWKVRTVTLPAKAQRLKQLTVLDGKLVIGIRPASEPNGGDSIWVVLNDSTLLPAKIGGVGPEMNSFFNYRGIPVTNRRRVDEINGPGSTVVSVVESGVTIVSKDLWWPNGYSTLIGATGKEGGAIVSYRGPVRTGTAYLPVLGDAVILNEPSKLALTDELRRENSFVFVDEIWVPIDGHIWKGKLNLPEAVKP